MASIPDNYEINVAKKRKPDDEYGVRCKYDTVGMSRKSKGGLVGMKYAAELYTRDIFLGKIASNTLRGIKQIASRKCNGYYSAIDELRFYRINDKEDRAILSRINKKIPNNTIKRGEWK